MFSERVQSMSESRPRARDGQREQTEARILSAAATLFSAQGYETTTVRAIAGAAGVSVGRVMAVGDKEHLLVLMVEGRLREVHDGRADCHGRRVDRAAGGEGRTADSSDLEDAVGNLVRPFIDIYVESPGLSRDYAAILARGQARSSVFDELAARLEAEFMEVIGDAGGRDPAGAARALYLVFIGALYAAAHGAVPFDGIEEDVRRAVQVVQGSTAEVGTEEGRS